MNPLFWVCVEAGVSGRAEILTSWQSGRMREGKSKEREEKERRGEERKGEREKAKRKKEEKGEEEKETAGEENLKRRVPVYPSQSHPQ